MRHRTRSGRSTLVAGVLTLAATVAAGTLTAQAAPGAPADAAALEAFMDGIMVAHMTDHEVLGATVAIVRVFPVLALVPGVAVVVGTVFAFQRRLWSAWGRAYFVVFALAVVAFVAQIQYWNLLGWRF